MSKRTLFDLRDHSSIDLDRLTMGINSGISEAKKFDLKELHEVLLSYRNLAEAARRIAIEREAESFAVEQAKNILNNTL